MTRKKIMPVDDAQTLLMMERMILGVDAGRSSPDGCKHPNHKPGNAAPPAVENDDRPTIYLHPGQLYAAPRPVAINTVLGSCVAICLWDPATGIGGANHYMLPSNLGSGRDSARFGDVAFPQLLKALIGHGVLVRNLRAKYSGARR